jgi:cell division protein FtsI/penicillin-binding protein 2
VESHSGKILGLYDNTGQSRKEYPVASLFKTITLASYLEEKGGDPEDIVKFKGNTHSTRKKSWKRGPIYNTTITAAFGKSNNAAFAAMGETLGYQKIKEMASLFGFGRNFFGFLRGRIDSVDVMYLASGIKGAYANPEFTVAMANVVARDGIFIRPYILESTGTRIIGRVLDNNIAKKIRKISRYTVTQGTAASSFRQAHLRHPAGGKTGSITGKNPPGRYDWFYCFAPLDNPVITVVVLIINGEYWKVKASYVGAEVMRIYLKSLKQESSSKVSEKHGGTENTGKKESCG